MEIEATLVLRAYAFMTCAKKSLLFILNSVTREHGNNVAFNTFP